MTTTHGKDDWGNGDFPQMERIWARLFPDVPFPESRLLATYHGEFGVSRARIRSNPVHIYEEILAVLQAPADDPIYKEEGHWSWKGVPDGCVCACVARYLLACSPKLMYGCVYESAGLKIHFLGIVLSERGRSCFSASTEGYRMTAHPGELRQPHATALTTSFSFLKRDTRQLPLGGTTMYK